MRIGVDVGGTKIHAVAVDRSGRIAAEFRSPTGGGSEQVVVGIAEAVRAVTARARGLPVDSVGVGIPGQVAGGRVRHALHLDIDDLDLADALASRVPVPVAVENDVRAAALGAAALRGGATSLAYLNLGTGIAAGIVAGGRLWRGARGGAGEIGHIAVDPAGPLCRCGQRGCIEALAGGEAVAARWRRTAVLPIVDLFDAADAGDARAAALRRGLVTGVAAAVQVLVLTSDVEQVVLGGGIAGLGERLADPVRAELVRRAGRSPFLRGVRLDGRIALLPAASPTAALGAALVGAASTPEEITVHG